MTDTATIDLQTAAEKLGVHYQTAYKWVRSGELPASIVRGRYELDPTIVDRYHSERSNPEPPPPRRPRRGFAKISADLLDALVEGDERRAHKIVTDLVINGVARTTVAQDVLAPALRQIGQRWHDGDVSIAVEHRATAITERLLGALHPTPRGRRRGVAVVATVSGDRHSMATAMAAIALRDDNWHVQHLGADVPAEEIEAFCEETPTDLVVLSVTHTDVEPTTNQLAERLRATGVRVLVGSPGSTLVELQETARAR